MSSVCPACSSKDKIVEKAIKIPVGRLHFETVAEVCDACGKYGLTPAIRKAMDEWGNAHQHNFIEFQPSLSKVVHTYLEEASKGLSLNKVDFIRLFTIFYLTEVVSHPEFESFKKWMKEHECYKLINEGPKSPVSVPYRYRAFRKIKMFSDIWEVTPAKAIEEAVNFCVGLKEYRDGSRLKEIAARLQTFVERAALAA